MKKRIYKLLLAFLLFFCIHLLIVNTNHSYLYTTIRHTLLKGRLGPAINEYPAFNNRSIKALQPKAWPLAANYNKKQIADEHLQVLEKFESIAFLIVKNDSLCFEKYWDGYGTQSLSNSFSMAKTFVGMLVGVAIQDGYIQSVNQPVSDFFPEYAQDSFNELTIKHLLTMSSGINFDEDYLNPFKFPAKANYGRELKALLAEYKRVQQPGVYYDYQSGTTQLLAFVIEKATGKNISQYFQEKIWTPIGAETDALWTLDKENGSEKAFCCLNSNARDFARLGKLYLDSGRVNGNQIIPLDFVLESIVPADLLFSEDNTPNHLYGYKWWIVQHKSHYIYYARGILGQYVFVIPDKKMLVVRLGHKRSSERINRHPVEMFHYIDAALEMYGE